MDNLTIEDIREFDSIIFDYYNNPPSKRVLKNDLSIIKDIDKLMKLYNYVSQTALTSEIAASVATAISFLWIERAKNHCNPV